MCADIQWMNSAVVSGVFGRRAVEMLTDMDGKEPQPGDLIEVFRGVYEHWAVYVGEGNIVHFGTDVSNSGQKGAVLKEKLKDVVKTNKWKINNYLDKKYKPRSSKDIVKEACRLVGSGWQYDLLTYNCQHFATEMRYGKPDCLQVEDAKAGLLEGILTVLLGLGSFAFRVIRG